MQLESKATSARERALSLLQEVDRGRRLDVAWEAAAPSMSPEDRPWVHGTVFGSIRLRGRFDHLLGLHLHRGLESVPLPLLQVLRLGAYQLFEMASVPGYAAVSQTVAQAGVVGGRKGAGLVNAVLRSLARKGAGIERFPDFESDPEGHLATWGSHPRWLVDRWVARFGPETARTIVEAGNQIPGLYIRPIGVSIADLADRLSEVGLSFEGGPAGSRTLRLPAGTDPGYILDAVPAIVQDPAASRIVEFANVRPGGRVADLCAAPGGKGIAMMGLGAWVVASDPGARRLRRMRGALRRLQLPERLVVARAEHPAFAPLDQVLTDVPCTGTGTLARHPDARWRLSPGDPVRMAAVQGRILEGAARMVRPGGVLIYSTCTLEAEENEQTVSEFLARNRDFHLEAGESELRILPGEMGTDGAFAARMRRD